MIHTHERTQLVGMSRLKQFSTPAPRATILQHADQHPWFAILVHRTHRCDLDRKVIDGTTSLCSI